MATERSTHAATTELAGTLRRNIAAVRDAIAAACRRAGRNPASVALLPITKYVDAAIARLVYDEGFHELGESTVQETLAKRRHLEDLEDLEWHLVGHLQRNKVARALELYTTIHSLDSLRLAREIDHRVRAAGAAAPPRLLVEVNVGGESSKGGVPVAVALDFLRDVRGETALGPSLAGLMALAPLADDPETVRPCFRRLRQLRDEAAAAGLLPPDAELSMGMSNDFAVAIEEGATRVRVGSRLFDGLPSRRQGG